MTANPQTWHYGLVARWWAEFEAGGPEIGYFQDMIGVYGQPALDVGCGTGRLLLPYLRAGLDVDGCDVSSDMVDLCRERASSDGLSPRLYVQAMHELDLPRKYRTVYVCGSFGIGGDGLQDREALERFYQVLEPGGALLLDLHLPYKNATNWGYYASGGRRELPEAWPASGDRRRASDGSELELRARVAEVDPLEQVITMQIRVVMLRDGAVVAEEEYTLKERVYLRNEMLLMLERAGFSHVEVRAGYTDGEPTVEDGVLVFIATK